MNIKFSIIVPCYNVEKYITECVESVINQTYENWELLLVDDLSEDGTLGVIRELKKKDARIQVYEKEHGGLPHTRNYGLNYASGDYVCLLDGDDYWSLDHLEKVADVICEHSTVDMIIQNQHTNFTRENLNKVVLFPLPQNELSQMQKLEHIFALSNCLPAAAVLTTYRMGFIRENGLRYGEQYSCSEDLDFFLQAISKNPQIEFAGNEFYFYRQDNQSAMTKSISGSMELDRLSIYKKWFDYYSGKMLNDFECKGIQNKIAKEMLTQIHIYRNIPKNDPQKRNVKKYFRKNRYIFAPNGRRGSFFYCYYILYPINRMKGKIYNIYNRIRNGEKTC